jgi:hypothetical protein
MVFTIYANFEKVLLLILKLLCQMNRLLKYNKSPGKYIAPKRTKNRKVIIIGKE